VSEAQLQASIVEAARYLGYRHYHTTDSRKSQPGFPDLVLVHRTTGRVIFAELKSETGRVTDAQQEWLTLLGKLHEVYLWRPAHWQDGTVRSVLVGDRVTAS
jgi:hypothetical protein